MRLPFSWLREYIETNLTPAEIGRILTQAGLEVDSIEEIASEELNKLDAVFEISLTPNLGHCNSVIGIARELSAATGAKICYPKLAVTESSGKVIGTQVKLNVEDWQGCPRYACRLIQGCKVMPSPLWLQERLTLCGIRPINNVVDIVNYVVLEMGHPLHAFDFNRLSGHQIIVRQASANEKFVTLDGVERVLAAGDVVICDAEKPVALAGIMGGENSEVTQITQDVLLEAAYFNPSTIRKSSKHLGLSTDASKRFERGTDPNALEAVLLRTTMLLQKWTEGQVVAGTLEAAAGAFLHKKITCRVSRVNQILGTQLSLGEVDAILKNLGFVCTLENNDQLHVIVPTYRADIFSEIDLIEEVARIYGYSNIGKAEPRYSTSRLRHAPLFLFERLVRTCLLQEGLQEFITCDLQGPSLLKKVQESVMPVEAQIQILNPASIEQSVLRTTLLPGLLQVVKHNIDRQIYDISGFELGQVHFKVDNTYREQAVVGVVLTGNSAFPHWEKRDHEVDFFDLKGILENLLQELRITHVTIKNSQYSPFHTGRQASIYSGELELGSFGEVHPAVLRRMDISARVYFAELSLQDLMQVRQAEQHMKPLPLYPGSERDWTVTVDEKLPIQDLLNAVQAASSSLLEEVSLQDIYRSPKLPLGTKNVTLHFIYRDWKKTVEQEVVENEHKRIIETVSKIDLLRN